VDLMIGCFFMAGRERFSFQGQGVVDVFFFSMMHSGVLELHGDRPSQRHELLPEESTTGLSCQQYLPKFQTIFKALRSLNL
jgi:hypothetical protein